MVRTFGLALGAAFVAACAAALAFPVGVLAESLPDGRGYEMVTPAEKPAGVQRGQAGWQAGASANGLHFFFQSKQPVLDGPPDQPIIYRADRTSTGWTVVSPGPRPRLSGGMSINHFDEASLGMLVTTTRNYASGDTDDLFFGQPVGIGDPDLYLIDAAGATAWRSEGELNNDALSFGDITFNSATPDNTHALFAWAGAPLVMADASRLSGRGLYESTTSQLRLVGVNNGGALLTDGTVWPGGPSSGINALSRDGARVFFTATGSGSPGLYVRENGQTTTPIPSAVANTTASYMAASADGAKVFFESDQQLTPDDLDSSPDVYEYDVSTQALTRISAGSAPAEVVQGKPAYVSDDGSRVYFVASGDLIPNQGTSGQARTWLYDKGQLKFVADAPVLSVGIHGTEACSTTRVTSDGRYLVFESAARLTPDDTDNASDVYLYDSVSQKLQRISQGPAGGNASVDAFINAHAPGGVACDDTFQQGSHSVTSDGQRVFFETSESLVSTDTNRAPDVYEWDATSGEASLISSGTGEAGAHYLDSTPSGDDVFFVTDERLVPQDRDVLPDIYDARVGGGFTPPPSGAPPCRESDCQGSGANAPEFTTPASITVFVPANSEGSAVDKGRIAVAPISAATKRRFGQTGRVRLTLRSTAPAHVSVRIRARVRASGQVVTRTIGFAARTFTRAGALRVTVQLSSAGRRLLARHKRLRVWLDVRQAGGSGVRSRAFILTRGRPR